MEVACLRPTPRVRMGIPLHLQGLGHQYSAYATLTKTISMLCCMSFGALSSAAGLMQKQTHECYQSSC